MGVDRGGVVSGDAELRQADDVVDGGGVSGAARFADLAVVLVAVEDLAADALPSGVFALAPAAHGLRLARKAITWSVIALASA